VLILTMKLWKLALFAQIWYKKATTPAILGRTDPDPWAEPTLTMTIIVVSYFHLQTSLPSILSTNSIMPGWAVARGCIINRSYTREPVNYTSILFGHLENQTLIPNTRATRTEFCIMTPIYFLFEDML
jgi:hypothetical protein